MQVKLAKAPLRVDHVTDLIAAMEDEKYSYALIMSDLFPVRSSNPRVDRPYSVLHTPLSSQSVGYWVTGLLKQCLDSSNLSSGYYNTAVTQAERTTHIDIGTERVKMREAHHEPFLETTGVERAEGREVKED